jgi:hypothetical protein
VSTSPVVLGQLKLLLDGKGTRGGNKLRGISPLLDFYYFLNFIWFFGFYSDFQFDCVNILFVLNLFIEMFFVYFCL